MSDLIPTVLVLDTKGSFAVFSIQGKTIGACENVHETIEDFLPTIHGALEAYGLVVSRMDIRDKVDYVVG